MTTADTGVDGFVELDALLTELSRESEIAAAAPRGAALYRYLANGEQLSGARGKAFSELVERLVLRSGIWWSPETYSRMPVLTPWCVRDRSCRYDQGPESWGAPREDGYMRDDNSIIKKLPLPLKIAAPEGHPYNGRKPWRGFTACHVWRDLPDGIAGEDPWLYSFVPNLVWLPRWLAPLSDIHGSRTQRLLQRVSRDLFEALPVAREHQTRVAANWARLPAPPAGTSPPTSELATFEPTPAFYARRLTTIHKVTDGCGQIQEGRLPRAKIVCSRYTNGLPDIDPLALASLSSDLRAYAEDTEMALAV
ncbi:MAG: hypothetical protein KC492_11805 [Myxococcales bacterium]|nr:hypothetical protein [Myxococcales bacterium]